MYASLLTKGLSMATDVVVSGCSAGGLATFLHTDQWCDALATDAKALSKCVGLPDSGFFLDYQSPLAPGKPLPSLVEEAGASSRRALTTPAGNYHAGLRWCFEAFNASAGVNQDCIAAKNTGGSPSDSPTYLCMFAEHTAVFTHTPLFALQSEYDSWQTGHVLHPGDSVQRLGDNLTKRIQANLFGPHPVSGAFLDSCHHHCGAWNQIRIDGQLVSEAFAQWYADMAPGTKRVWKQGQAYPCDDCCKP
jgi:STAM-binding protein